MRVAMALAHSDFVGWKVPASIWTIQLPISVGSVPEIEFPANLSSSMLKSPISVGRVPWMPEFSHLVLNLRYTRRIAHW